MSFSSRSTSSTAIPTRHAAGEPPVEEKNWLNYAMVAAVFVAVGLLRWPIWWVLLVLIPLSITIAWRTRP
jgi:hypothetical protein